MAVPITKDENDLLYQKKNNEGLNQDPACLGVALCRHPGDAQQLGTSLVLFVRTCSHSLYAQHSTPHPQLRGVQTSGRRLIVSMRCRLPNRVRQEIIFSTFCWADQAYHTPGCLHLNTPTNDLQHKQVACYGNFVLNFIQCYNPNDLIFILSPFGSPPGLWGVCARIPAKLRSADCKTCVG